MTTFEVMEKKKKWNIFVSESIAEPFDEIAKDQRGDKGLLVSLGCFLVLTMTPEQRQEAMRKISRAVHESRYGVSAFDEAKKLFGITPADASKPTHLWPGVPNPIGEIVDEVARDLSDVKPDRPPSAPARGAGKAKR